MHAFDYEAPTSIQQAAELLARHNGTARLLAGGTDLIDQMRLGRWTPQLVIDVKKIPELNVLEFDGRGLRLGAAVPCSRIAAEPAIKEKFAALADSCGIIGGIQIQTRATVGGNLCNSGPAADTVPALIAMRGVCVIGGKSGSREVPVESFCTGPGKNVLQPGELLVELRFPAPTAGSGSHYRRLIPRNEMDIAVVGVGASVSLTDGGRTIAAARIALGAVAPVPLLAAEASDSLTGRAVNDDAFSAAAALARKIVQPITDMRGTKEYRTHVTGILVQRVLRAAVARARGEALDYRPGH